MRSSAGVAKCLGVALALVATTAHGQRAVTLRWTAPEGCPSQAAVDAEVTRLLAAAKTDPARPPLEARGTVTRAADEYRLRLEISREGTTSLREVAGPTCLGVAHAAALMVAMAIDPEAARAAAPPATPLPESPTPPAPATPTPSLPATASAAAPPPGTGPAPAPAVPPKALAPAAASPRSGSSSTGRPSTAPPDRPGSRGDSEPSIGWRLLAGALGDLGTLGVPTVALEVGAAMRVRAFRADATVAFWPEREVVVDAPADTGARLDLVTGALSACWAPPPIARALGPRLELDLPCLGAELGRMGGRGFGVTQEREGAGLWAAGRLGSAGAVLLEPWVALRLRVEAVVPAVRPRFLLGGVGTVHEPVLAGRAALTLEVAPTGW